MTDLTYPQAPAWGWRASTTRPDTGRAGRLLVAGGVVQLAEALVAGLVGFVALLAGQLLASRFATLSAGAGIQSLGRAATRAGAGLLVLAALLAALAVLVIRGRRWAAVASATLHVPAVLLVATHLTRAGGTGWTAVVLGCLLVPVGLLLTAVGGRPRTVPAAEAGPAG